MSRNIRSTKAVLTAIVLILAVRDSEHRGQPSVDEVLGSL